LFRDLKPDNVVLDEEGHAILTDFGLSREGIETENAESFCGSYAYLAPEMLKREGHGKSVDWYLLGVFLYEMLFGIPPYYDHDRDILFSNILEQELQFPHANISEEARDLLAQVTPHF
jgi:serine/threonine protein kinase